MRNAVLLSSNPEAVRRVYGLGRLDDLAGRTRLYRPVITEAEFDRHLEGLAKAEVAFSTWGMWPLTPAQLEAMPRLRAVFYAAGSVRAFAPPLFERGITLVSGWAANAVPVAEFTLAHVLLSMKGWHRNTRQCRDPQIRRARGCFIGPGNFGETVAVIGCGMIGRKLIELLRPFRLEVMAVDPRLDDRGAADLGVRKADLDTACAEALVITNHTPDLPRNRGLFTRARFESMRPNATFINTGRGAQVVEADLADVLRARPDLTALLDVTDPEPPDAGSSFYSLPNAWLSSHIAGAIGAEVVRMADAVCEEFDAWDAGRPLRYEVRPDMLEWMA